MKTLLLLLLLSCAHLRLDALELPRRNSGRQGWKRKSSSSGINNSPLNLGLIVPHSIYNDREYNKAVGATLGELQRSKRTEFKFLQDIEFAQDQVNTHRFSAMFTESDRFSFLPGSQDHDEGQPKSDR